MQSKSTLETRVTRCRGCRHRLHSSPALDASPCECRVHVGCKSNGAQSRPPEASAVLPQAWVVRTAALRRTFVSVKGFYFQADVVGQPVTWLVPHALSQVSMPVQAAPAAMSLFRCSPTLGTPSISGL